ncbi:hypothetical protein [Nannocystis punicea]|uniref:Uncharacterized protein n=1 Tax=Nannocystis punicea TaxID=2995304 RepID=A0ABY7HET1_9BACT|nr:hypothetical protein [Nannocystis poenicansa]WAS97796.1 hypothetical protein O0S08_16770 [Nannocystis poenicansa]
MKTRIGPGLSMRPAGHIVGAGNGVYRLSIIGAALANVCVAAIQMGAYIPNALLWVDARVALRELIADAVVAAFVASQFGRPKTSLPRSSASAA